MKTFQTFCSDIAEQVREHLGEGYEVRLRSVRKNNNVTLEGLMIRCGDRNVVPTIYLDPYYEQYREGRIEEHILEDILKLYEDSREPWKTEPSFDFESIREKVFFRLMNLQRNREELAAMPHIEIGDLAVGFQWSVDTDDCRVGTVRITDEQADMWGVTTEELTDLAIKNAERSAPPVLRSIEDVLLEILDNGELPFGSEENEEKARLKETLSNEESRREFPMYVLTNGNSNMGAAALLALPFLERFREKLGEDFWILPSSIHEVILIPVSKANDRRKLSDMVREINETQVPLQEFLSDEVYCYSEFENLMPEDFREKLLAAG
ncbi:MAG: hypothetical protein IKX54_00610 [Lachnospiraceae bacterium]|nr:hypothetical protein [Lachnospiraceae bacterium]